MVRRRRSFKQETAIDRYGSRKYRAPPADRGPRPKAYKRSKVWVGKHSRGSGSVKGHFRDAPRRRRR